EYWHCFKKGALTREELEIWMRPIRQHFEAVLERAVADDIDRVAGSTPGAVVSTRVEVNRTRTTGQSTRPGRLHARGGEPCAPTPPPHRRDVVSTRVEVNRKWGDWV